MFGNRLRLYFGVSFIVFAIAVVMAAWGFPRIVQKRIQQSVQLDNSSVMFEKWRKLPMPLTFQITVFNVTNPEEVNKGGKPKLAEMGPYVYDEYREKTILGYGENDTIKYNLKKTFFFNQNATGDLSEDDEVTVINFSYMAALLGVQEMMPGLVPMVNEALGIFFSNLTDPFLRVRVRDLFFDGVFLNCEGENSALGLVCGKIRSETPPTMRAAEDGNGFFFSMFSHLNRTESGPYEMARGIQDLNELGHIVSFEGRSHMTAWKDQYCGQLNGSDASIFPPINENRVPERLYTFEPQICRSLYASLVGKRTLFNMSAYYYEISEAALAAKSANPNNKCFCRNNWSANHDGCLVMGLLNLMPCQGAPAIASLPHFYLASEELLDYFAAGVEPREDRHKSFVYIEPKTGAVLQGAQRLQFNIELRNMKGVPQLENVPTGLFPMLWVSEGATLPESLIEELRQAHKLMSYVEATRWILLAVGIFAVVASAVALARAGLMPMYGHRGNSISFIMSPGSISPSEPSKVQ